jgi:hypothetical protein
MAMNKLILFEQVLRSLTALFVIVAAGALLWRPAVPNDEIPPEGIGTHSMKHAPAAPLDVTANQVIVEGNIFSAARKAPAVRYNPFEPDWGSVGTGVTEPVAEAPAADANPEGAGVPKLFGTMVGPHGAAALLRLDASLPEAQIYREGDRAGGYRVEKINEQSVVLRGPAGRVELRLVRPEGTEEGPNEERGQPRET